MFKPASKTAKQPLLALAVLIILLVTLLTACGSNPTATPAPQPTAAPTETPTVAPTTAPATTAPVTTAPATTAPARTTPTTRATEVAPTTAPTRTAPAATTVPARPTQAVIVPTVAPTPTIAAPAGYQVFRNSNPNQLNLEIAYPQGWTVKPNADNTLVAISDGKQTQITLARLNGLKKDLTTQELNAVIIEELIKQGYKSEPGGTRLYGFAGEIWLSSVLRKDNSLALSSVALHNGIPYAVTIDSVDKDAAALGKRFDQMLTTMRFSNSPYGYYAGELKSFTNSGKDFTVNYPAYDYELDSEQPLQISSKANKGVGMLVLNPSKADIEITEAVDVLKDVTFKNGIFTNAKEISRTGITSYGDKNLEQAIAFSFGSNRLGLLVIRKVGNTFYPAVMVGDKSEDLQNIYYLMWRYTIFMSK